MNKAVEIWSGIERKIMHISVEIEFRRTQKFVIAMFIW